MSSRLEGSEGTDTVVRPKVFLETGEIIPGYHEDRQGSESFLQVDAAWGVASSTTVFASLPLSTHKYYVIGHGGPRRPTTSTAWGTRWSGPGRRSCAGRGRCWW